MNVTKSLSVDYQNKGFPQVVNCKQYDAQTRYIAMTLLSGGVAFTMPASPTFAVGCKRGDGAEIFYNTIVNAICSTGLTVSVDPKAWNEKALESGLFAYNGTAWRLNGETVDLADYGITITSGTPATGDTIQINSHDAVTYSGNVVTVEVAGSCLEESGHAKFDLYVFDDTAQIGTFSIMLAVEEAAVDVREYTAFESSSGYIGRRKYDLTDYKSITAAIRRGDSDMIPNGTEFTVPHAVFGNIVFITRMKNAFKVHGEPDRPNICIQPKYLLSNSGGSTAITFQYDRPEAFKKVNTAIPAGTVCKFNTIAYGSWAAGDYNFTATDDIPAGSMLCISGYQNTALTSLTVDVYANQKDTTKSVSYAISSGDGGATEDLGTWGTDCNHPQRVSYGSNNEEQSNIFQFLNGDSGDAYMDSIWEPKTEYDMMATAFTSLKGFLGGFPDDFRACLALCDIPNLTNNVYEDAPYHTSEHYSHTGYFFLPSRKEIYGSTENANETDETQMPYYAEVGTTDADKLMYANGAVSATSYWLRTPNASHAYGVRICLAGAGGALNYNYAFNSYGAAPLAILA